MAKHTVTIIVFDRSIYNLTMAMRVWLKNWSILTDYLYMIYCYPMTIKICDFHSCPLGLFYGVWRHIQQYFSYIMAVSFIGGGNRSTAENHQPVASYWQTLSHNVVSSTPRDEQGSNSQL